MPLPEMRTCRCGGYLPVGDDRLWPEHNVGDAPRWWGDPRCVLSGKPTQRRQPRADGKWWSKYLKGKT